MINNVLLLLCFTYVRTPNYRRMLVSEAFGIDRRETCLSCPSGVSPDFRHRTCIRS